MVEPTRIPERQLDLGAAAYFKVVPEATPGNQVEVNPGFVYAGGFSISDAFTGGPQTSPAFSPVAPAMQRYDLVYVDQVGGIALLAGTQVAFGSPAYNGAPGFTAGPDMPDNAVPVAYVFVDEVGAVVVDSDDITNLGGQFHAGRDYQGYRVDKGLFGSAPSGTTDVFTPLFSTETPSGGSAPGVVTSPPDNYMDVLDQNQDEIKHTTGAKMYVRLTEAAGVWTGNYHYIDGTGTEQTMDPSTDTAGAAPTDLRLIGVRKIFSRNDPARPMFDDAASRVSDQLVGTIPDGSETVKGKVEFAPDLGTAILEAVQGSDSRLGAVTVEDEGVSQGLQSILDFVGAGVTAAGGTITIPGAGAPTALQVSAVLAATWTATNGVFSTGALVFVPKVAICVSAFMSDGSSADTLSTACVGFATSTSARSVGMENHTQGTGNAGHSIISGSAIGGHGGASGSPARKTSYDLMTLNVTTFSQALGVSIQPNVAIDHGTAYLIVFG